MSSFPPTYVLRFEERDLTHVHHTVTIIHTRFCFRPHLHQKLSQTRYVNSWVTEAQCALQEKLELGSSQQASGNPCFTGYPLNSSLVPGSQLVVEKLESKGVRQSIICNMAEVVAGFQSMCFCSRSNSNTSYCNIKLFSTSSSG